MTAAPAEAFMRFQQASDILHGYTRSITQAPLELTSRISAALAAEPVYSIDSQNKSTAKLLPFPKNFWKQATGLAMAASVGALAVGRRFFSNKTDSTICP